jgi:hypothetical protein
MLPAQALFGKKKSASKRHLVGNKKDAWMIPKRAIIKFFSNQSRLVSSNAKDALALLISNDNKIY